MPFFLKESMKDIDQVAPAKLLTELRLAEAHLEIAGGNIGNAWKAMALSALADLFGRDAAIDEQKNVFKREFTNKLRLGDEQKAMPAGDLGSVVDHVYR